LGILLTLAVFLVIVALITTSEAELSSIRHQLLTAGLDLRATETQLGHAKSELDNANKELSLKTAALTQLSSDAAKNSEFVVFLHYRPKVSYSKSFAEAARQALVNAGFRVPPAGGNGPNVHDQPTDAAEGPHVDWFQKPGAVEAESEASRQAETQRLAHGGKCRSEPIHRCVVLSGSRTPANGEGAPNKLKNDAGRYCA
jgi:hypothetical protein